MRAKSKRKVLSIITLLLFIIPFMYSCGSSSNDEPDTPNNPVALGTISYEILPGQWILESFIPEKGDVVIINQPFTILPFTVKQESDNIAVDKGYQFWAESYSHFTQVYTLDEIEESYGIVGFTKKQKDPLSSSNVYELCLNLSDSNGSGTHIVVMSDMSIKNNILTANVASYGHLGYGSVTEPTTGKLTMRKTN